VLPSFWPKCLELRAALPSWQQPAAASSWLGRPRDELPAMVRGKENWNTLNYSKQRLTDDDIAGLHLSQVGNEALKL